MKISVIIPCYNDGVFLIEAVDSVLACDYKNLELIIVNDGSTDNITLDILTKYKEQGLKVISHPNQGLSFSRNLGIQLARGEYILSLDADNKIRKGYLDKAIAILDNQAFDIIYARPFFFGEDIAERKFNTHDFESDQLFVQNFIDACAIYRKTVWEAVGGYDEKLTALEDWEFWINCYIKGFNFKFLDEQLYDYRIKSNSMISETSTPKTAEIVNYIIAKHNDAFRQHLYSLNTYRLFYQNDQRNYLRTSIKYFNKWLRSLFEKHV